MHASYTSARVCVCVCVWYTRVVEHFCRIPQHKNDDVCEWVMLCMVWGQLDRSEYICSSVHPSLDIAHRHLENLGCTTHRTIQHTHTHTQYECKFSTFFVRSFVCTSFLGVDRDGGSVVTTAKKKCVQTSLVYRIRLVKCIFNDLFGTNRYYYGMPSKLCEFRWRKQNGIYH